MLPGISGLAEFVEIAIHPVLGRELRTVFDADARATAGALCLRSLAPAVRTSVLPISDWN